MKIYKEGKLPLYHNFFFISSTQCRSLEIDELQSIAQKLHLFIIYKLSQKKRRLVYLIAFPITEYFTCTQYFKKIIPDKANFQTHLLLFIYTHLNVLQNIVTITYVLGGNKKVRCRFSINE